MKAKHAHEAAREVYLGDFVPYSGHVSDTVIKTVDGAYCKTWRIEGIPFETTDKEDLHIRHEAFNQLVRGLGDSALWTHRVRREFSDRLNDQYPNDFAQDIAQRYYDGFTGYRMMINETYITLLYRPHLAKIASSPFSRFISGSTTRSAAQIKQDERAALKVMDELSHQLESGLKKYEPTALGLIEENRESEESEESEKQNHSGEDSHSARAKSFAKTPLTISEPLTFYGFLLNGVWQKIALQKASIKDYLPHVRLFFGGEKLEIRTPDKQFFAALLDLKDYSDRSFPGTLNTLFYAPFTFVETQSFSILSKPDAKSALEIQRNQLVATEDAAGSQIEQMEQALDQLINGKFVMGEYHYSLAVFGKTPDEAAKNLSYASAALNDAGFQAALIDLVADAAWFAQLPGNWKYRTRASKITSRNF